MTDPGNRCQWCLVSQEVIWCCLALMSGKMCGRHLGGIFLCAHERIPRGLGRFSFSKAWRAVSGGEARKLLRSALPTNIRFNGRHFRSTTSGEKYRKKYLAEFSRCTFVFSSIFNRSWHKSTSPNTTNLFLLLSN